MRVAYEVAAVITEAMQWKLEVICALCPCCCDSRAALVSLRTQTLESNSHKTQYIEVGPEPVGSSSVRPTSTYSNRASLHFTQPPDHGPEFSTRNLFSDASFRPGPFCRWGYGFDSLIPSKYLGQVKYKYLETHKIFLAILW